MNRENLRSTNPTKTFFLFLLLSFSCLLLSCSQEASHVTSASLSNLSLQAFITLPDGKTQEVSAEIFLTPAGEPRRALGKTPQIITALLPATYLVELSFPGFFASESVTLSPGETLTLALSLRPLAPPALPLKL